MRTFFLRTKSGEGDATLFTRIRKRSPKVDILISSLIKIDVATWEKANSTLEEWNKFLRTKDGKEVYAKMQGVSDVIDSLTEQGVFDKDIIDEAVADVIFKEAREQQRIREEEERKAQEEQMRIEAEKEAARKTDVILFMQDFLDGIRSGEIKYNGETYEKNTCKAWGSFFGVLKRFYKKHPFTWADIDETLTDSFINFMEKEGYMVKSVNKYLITFRAMVGYAYKKRLHNNTRALTAFSTKKVQETDKAKEIYLTEQELQALYEMKLDGLKSVVRDVFLVGCYTCQRFTAAWNVRTLSPHPKGQRLCVSFRKRQVTPWLYLY